MSSKMWPIYYKDLLYLSNLKSTVGIVTLWTPKEAICSKIDKNLFAVGGQLYSKRGINFMIRNILANPFISKIIICGADRSGSGEALINLFKNGIDKENRIIKSEDTQIDQQIDASAIEDFRKNIKLINLNGEIEPEKIKTKLKTFEKEKSKLWSKPRQFKELKKIKVEKFPSEKVTFYTRADYIWQAWVQMVRKIWKFGSIKGMIKVGQVKELVNLVTVIQNEDPYKPLNLELFGLNRKDLDVYYKAFFTPSKGAEAYNYGERIFKYPLIDKEVKYNSEQNNYPENTVNINSQISLDQLEECFEKFKRYHDDRGLVISIWNPWVDNVSKGWMADKKGKKEIQKGGNVPCMSLIQFTYRSKKLHLTAYFRSNDIFKGWPLNAFALRKLQYDFAQRIGKKAGYLTTISNCSQIYETDYSIAEQLLKMYQNKPFCMSDPRSNFIYEIDKEDIVVKHMSPDGEEQLDEFRVNGRQSKAALKMCDLLLSNEAVSDLGHAMDVGRQLAKIEMAIKNRIKFVQDKPISINE